MSRWPLETALLLPSPLTDLWAEDGLPVDGVSQRKELLDETDDVLDRSDGREEAEKRGKRVQSATRLRSTHPLGHRVHRRQCRASSSLADGRLDSTPPQVFVVVLASTSDRDVAVILFEDRCRQAGHEGVVEARAFGGDPFARAGASSVESHRDSGWFTVERACSQCR